MAIKICQGDKSQKMQYENVKNVAKTVISGKLERRKTTTFEKDIFGTVAR